MDLPIQHYKENGTDEQLAMRTEWEPCLAHHPPLQSFACDAELAERGSSGGGGGIGAPPPPPPPSKRRFRSPTSRSKAGEPDGKMRDNLMERQVTANDAFCQHCRPAAKPSFGASPRHLIQPASRGQLNPRSYRLSCAASIMQLRCSPDRGRVSSY